MNGGMGWGGVGGVGGDKNNHEDTVQSGYDSTIGPDKPRRCKRRFTDIG